MKTCLLILSIILLSQFGGINSLSGQTADWEWAISAGGSTVVHSTGITVDGNGNSYVTGLFFTGSISLGGITLTNSGSSYDIFFAKYDPSGAVLWAKSVGGDSYDKGMSIGNDIDGNIYLTGFFQSSHVTFGNITLFSADSNYTNENYFIAKYNTTGDVVWAKSFGGTGSYGNVSGNDIRVDSSGNCFVTGEFSIDTLMFDTISLVNSDAGHGDDIFIAKYDSSGNILWANSAGSTYVGGSNGISVDISGNSYIIGEYNNSQGMNFGSVSLPASHNFDAFVAKYDQSGNAIWARQIGGSDRDFGKDISVDNNNNCYVTGYFLNDTLIFGIDTLLSNGGYDAYIVKYDSSGNVLWAQIVGGLNNEYGLSIEADLSGYILLTGAFDSNSLIVGNNTLTNNGLLDVYIIKFNFAGTVLWAQSAGGVGNDAGTKISFDATGSTFITGGFESNSINFGSNVLTNSGSGGEDIFVVKESDGVGIDAITNDNSILVYPNPSHGQLNIYLKAVFQKGILSIYNTIGEKIIWKNISGKYNTIDADFKPGIYFIQITDGPLTWKRKIIIESY